jgi:hypothetical protein
MPSSMYGAASHELECRAGPLRPQIDASKRDRLLLIELNVVMIAAATAKKVSAEQKFAC